jgi:diguanylate cyclase (GGDEF)-like protein
MIVSMRRSGGRKSGSLHHGEAGDGVDLDLNGGSFANDLKALHEISMELSLTEDVDSLCRRAVELGRERLGFDRIGIWFVDPEDPEWNVGSWRIDDGGTLLDERRRRVRRHPATASTEFHEGALSFLSFENEIAGDGKGRGLTALAPLWDGRRMIGELTVDGTLGMQRSAEQKREILILFARIVAHLTSLKRAEAELRLLASTDSLTGLVNRRTALIILEKQLGLCLRGGSDLTVCLADLDSLKRVNDGYGHAAGDSYLKAVCASFVDQLRASDTVGRLGGDEFIVIFPDCQREEAAAIMRRVEAALVEAGRGLPYRPSLSWGLASLDELAPGTSPESSALQGSMAELLELADRRMYEIKRGRESSRP